MNGKQKAFLDLLKTQPEENWRKGSYGSSVDDKHCKYGYALWKTVPHEMKEASSLSMARADTAIKEQFDVTMHDSSKIIGLNDEADYAEDAQQRIEVYFAFKYGAYVA
jgi:hypothetical protein